MFSHIILGARDLERLGRFYDAVLAPLGLTRNPDENGDDGGPAGIIWTASGRRWPQFCVQLPWNGEAATAGNGVQVSFAAASPAVVDDAWAAALAHGGTDEGPPGPRPHYAPDYYGAYARDPEGNKLCFVHAGGMAALTPPPRET
jgi:catechol 2,3-dioxygenase-like lactoylglutathione lyase family enzyme